MESASNYIQDATERIVKAFDPERVILFGSRARSEERAHSDVDLLVVLSRLENKREATVAMRRMLSDLPMAKDIVLTTPEEIKRRGDLVGTVLRPALREGKVLYQKSGTGL